MIYFTYASEFPVLNATIDNDVHPNVAGEVFTMGHVAHLARIVAENEWLAKCIVAQTVLVQDSHGRHIASVHGAPVGPYSCDCDGCNAERNLEAEYEIACGC